MLRVRQADTRLAALTLTLRTVVTSSVMLPLDANELKSEAQRIATALEDDSIAVVDLRKLARICAQHPLHEKADSAANGYASNEAMWTEGRLFERVFEGITVQLRRPMEVSSLCWPRKSRCRRSYRART